jgi:vancomycin permeability regulator SanA
VPRPARFALVLARGGALFLGVFVWIGLIGELRLRQSDIALWFVDVRDLGSFAEAFLLAVFGTTLLGWAILGPGHRWVGAATTAVSTLFAVFAVRDAIRFLELVGTGSIEPAVAIPLSALFAVGLAGLAIVAWATRRPRSHILRPGWRGAGSIAVAGFGWAVAFALAQMAFFGTTDYRRMADAAVVFGARVYATGEPSPLLADRIDTAVGLYRGGEVPLLIMSGGDGSDGYNEAAVMADRAVAAGVPRAAVVVDRIGNSTEATVANTVAWASRGRGGATPAGLRLIAVSQAYHLPRIQLAFAASGIDVLTVPAVGPDPIVEMPLFVAREVPAFWSYYLRECLG